MKDMLSPDKWLPKQVGQSKLGYGRPDTLWEDLGMANATWA